EFMKRALDFREYHDAKPFRAPDGIVTIDIDPLSGMPATPSCPKVRSEVYIAGTQPVGQCPLHGGRQGITNIAGWDTEQPAPVRALPEPEPRGNAVRSDSEAHGVATRLRLGKRVATPCGPILKRRLTGQPSIPDPM